MEIVCSQPLQTRGLASMGSALLFVFFFQNSPILFFFFPPNFHGKFIVNVYLQFGDSFSFSSQCISLGMNSMWIFPIRGPSWFLSPSE